MPAMRSTRTVENVYERRSPQPLVLVPGRHLLTLDNDGNVSTPKPIGLFNERGCFRASRYSFGHNICYTKLSSKSSRST